MGVGLGVSKLKVSGLCLLLLIMSFFLLPGSQGETCKVPSQTYTSPSCTTDPCVGHCILEGFDSSVCEGSYFDPYKIFCFCERPC